MLIRAGALGDIVLTLPVLDAIRRRYPTARITVVGYPELWRLAGDRVARIESIDSARFSTLFEPVASPDLLAWLAPFQLAVAWTVRDPTPILHAAGIPAIVHATPYPPPGVHEADWLLRTLGLPLPSREPELKARPPRVGGPIFIHPGAGADWKRWPPDRFADLAHHLVRRGLRVTLVEGPADGKVVRQVQGAISLPIVREDSLPALAAALAEGRLFIGNDSGPTHLAAAAGVPTLALFGPTDPVSWAPIGDVAVLRRCEATAPHQGQIRVCPDPGCMEALSVSEVLEAADCLLRRDVDNSVDNLQRAVENGRSPA